jgi:hypothetical protein
MRGVIRGIVVAATAVAIGAAPAAANPFAEDEPSIFLTYGPLVIFGGLAAGFVIYKVCKWRAAKRPAFVGEDVTITLEPGRARVAGVYRFHNPDDKPHTLGVRYPFVRGRDLGEPANVVILDGAGEALPYGWKSGDAAFELTVPPGEDAALTVTFEQEFRGAEYTYILTSTRKWHRPIDEARFTVEAPAQFAPLACPYDWEEVPAAAGLVRYELRREGFYPDVDLRIHWKRPDFAFSPSAMEEHTAAVP